MTGHIAPGGIAPAVPVLSMFDPIHVGIDEFGAARAHPDHLQEPARRRRTRRRQIRAAEHPRRARRPVGPPRLVLFDGKQVELGMWKTIADEFVGPDLRPRHHHPAPPAEASWTTGTPGCAPAAAARSNPTTASPSSPRSSMRSPCTPPCWAPRPSSEEFITLFRDLVARGRAAAMPVIAATQRPSVDIIPKSLRDLFGYRAAFRCTSDRQQRHHPRRRLVRRRIHRHRHPARPTRAVPT